MTKNDLLIEITRTRHTLDILRDHMQSLEIQPSQGRDYEAMLRAVEDARTQMGGAHDWAILLGANSSRALVQVTS